MPWTVLAVSLSISVWAYQAAETALSLRDMIRFDGRVEDIRTAIRDRMQVYEQALHGARGLFAASKSVERLEWREYISSINISKSYPGVKGLAFVSHVPHAKLESFLAWTRADGAPNFEIHPKQIRDDYYVITYIEPEPENRRLLGFDIGSDTLVRRPAADLSVEEGRAILSGKILSEHGGSPFLGSIFLLPVYRTGAPVGTAGERRAALIGWIYGRLDAQELMKGILGGGPADIGFSIYDGIEMTAESRLYEKAPDLVGPPDYRPTFSHTSPIEVGRRVWMTNFYSRPEFDAAGDHTSAYLVLIAGLLGSFLLFSITWSLATTRRRALAEAELMTARFRAVLETASDAFIAVDAAGRISDWNRRAELTFRWRRPEVLGRSLVDLLAPPKYREAVLKQMQEFQAKGESPYLNRRMELIALRRDGSEFPVEVTVWPIWDERGSFTFNAFVHDITERQRARKDILMARDAAVGANRAKSEFLANMSHELRAPLNSILGFANILLQNKTGSLQDPDLAFVDRIQENAVHLLNLINQVLDLSKVEAGQTDLEIEPLYLDVLVQETIQQMESRVLGRDIKLLTDLPPVLAPIETDAIKLKQILINLIGNAIKFTEKGSVTVRVMDDPETHHPVRIDVIDTGIGVPPDLQDAIFEPFQQGDRRTSLKYGGTGLGLSITRSLCQLMGYKISVESVRGKGSVFMVTIPAESLRRTRPVDEDTPSRSARKISLSRALPVEESVARSLFAGKCVLVIDDDPDSRLLLTHYFGDFGMRVISAGGGDHGIAMARQDRPDLITVDLMLPQKNGWQVMLDLQRDPVLRDIPVIVISTIADDNWQAFNDKIDRLNKPVNREELFLVLRKNLALPPPPAA
ncbi:MAG: hypothetical protein A3G34_17070 [Candidatus Lindowbacteria bacterium RIFCSPLOWO2_12_FULL_62_27]|nr:MAG: hypothetical protein A3G34_17070 [Candidatus Lindowbacteria bacterium RIFCSPLOWO2_12_FULL_62_27]